MAETPRSTQMRTPEGRAAYVSVFERRVNRKNPERQGKFQLCFIIPKEVDIKYMMAEAKRVGEAKFGPDFMAKCKAKKLYWPFLDGDIERAGQSEFKGQRFIQCKSGNPVGVVDRKRQMLTSPEQFGSGDYCMLQVNFYAFDNESKGVACGLLAVQRTKKGEPLDGRVNAADVFDELEGGEDDFDAESETTTADDDFDV